MSFFIDSGSKKRKPVSKAQGKKFVPKRKPLEKRKKKINDNENEEITSSSASGDSDDEFLNFNDDDNRKKKQVDENIDIVDTESANEKRLRLAKTYLTELDKRREDNEQKERETNAQNEEGEPIAARQQRFIASNVQVQSSSIRTIKSHFRNVTDTCVSADGRIIISTHNDGTIVKYDTETGKILHKQYGCGAKTTKKTDEPNEKQHVGSVNAITISQDDDSTIFCTGGDDKTVRVWDLNEMKCIKTFTGHRQAVTCITLRRTNDRHLFTGSVDRSVKAWDLRQMGYVDTMFGHTDTVTSIDSLTRERCVCVGERSARIWKLADESQLVFNANMSCNTLECVRLINEEHFVTGAADGSLSVWSAFKKKPVCTVLNAHQIATGCSSICSIATLPYSDLIATGSADGFVKLWQVSKDYKMLTKLLDIPVIGFINSLQFNTDGTLLIVGVGRTHKRGRWWPAESCHNSILTIPMDYK